MNNLLENDIIVAGHICVDVIVELDSDATSVDSLFVPGKLLEVGPPVVSGGGAVFNTGIALHRLGQRVRLVGKAGNDLYGQSIINLLQQEDEQLAGNMVILPDASSSYTLVLSSPRMDRVFLHHPGANDTFSPEDVADDILQGARIFHFGYPPLMKHFYSDGGKSLAALFGRVREQGLMVSLDMAKPDPESEAGRTDWNAWLSTVLPHVDIFLPSIDEILYMLDRSRYDQIVGKVGVENLMTQINGELLGKLSGELLSQGAAIVIIKLGEEGLYLRTSDDAPHLKQLNAGGEIITINDWTGVEMLRPCFQTEVVGTTGSGDCAIAGFLSAISRNETPACALENAAAVGAISVEQTSSVSAIPVQEAVSERIKSGWLQRKTTIPLPGWTWDEKSDVWRGPFHK